MKLSTTTILKVADTQRDLDESTQDHAVMNPIPRADGPLVIPTEPIGSIPRPSHLIEAIAAGHIDDPDLRPLFEEAVRDTVERFEETGSPVITDGEQRKYHNFWTYSVHGMPNTTPDGFRIPFSAGHTRRMPRLMCGPFRYQRYADSLPERRNAIFPSTGETGGDFPVSDEPDVSSEWNSSLFQGGIHWRLVK